MDQRRGERSGMLLGTLAYVWWGFFPLYFPLMAPASAAEVVAHRIVWSLLTCLLLLLVARAIGQLLTTMRVRRTVFGLTAAALLLTTNWLVFIVGVNSGHTVDAALGYFINPLVTVVLGVILFGEHLRPGQWVAVGFGVVAVLVFTFGYGQIPWVGLILAATFGGYGVIKKKLSAQVPATVGLAAETLIIAPAALIWIGWYQLQGASTFPQGTGHTWLLISLGVVTTVPLLAFSAAAGRLPLATLGLLQYITPLMHLSIGVWIRHEPMPTARWVGFALTGVAVLVLVWDGLRHAQYRDST